MHQSILNFKKARYLWVSLFLCVIAILAYAIDQPTMPANGGTVLGYILGTVSAFLILLLMWFGIRKRRYKSRMGTAVGWLSAHLYLGLSLLVLATLHTGFSAWLECAYTGLCINGDCHYQWYLRCLLLSALPDIDD